MKNNFTIKHLVFIIFFVIFFSIIADTLSSINVNNTKDNEYNSEYLRLISSSENKVLEDDIYKLAKDNNIKITIDYADTLDIIDKLNAHEKYDAVWSSNSIWLYNIDSKSVSIKDSKSLSINPVIFGIKKSKAEELGFIDKKIYTKDILAAIRSGKLSFYMANPTSTNSGASAYLGLLSTLAGNPEVLTKEMLESNTLKEELKTLFKGLKRTSGSEDFLEELSLNSEYDAVVTYESSIININKKLEESNKETLYAIYPVDGVSISDSVLAFIDQKDDHKKEMFDKLQSLLLGSNGQKLLESYGRRTWYGGINLKAPKDIFNPKWGIDTTNYITPTKYPSKEVINAALTLYQTELRKPVHVVFCLDYSGSMIGSGIEELHNAMEFILKEELSSSKNIQFSKYDIVDIVPFETSVGPNWSSKDNTYNELLEKIKNKQPSGSTALYPSVEEAIMLLKDEDFEKYNVSVIVMTDGAGNVGTYEKLEHVYKNVNKEIPIYSITFGYASEYQLEKLSSLSNGKVFDGKQDLVLAFKKVRGYN